MDPMEDSYLDTYWEDQYEVLGDHDEVNYDPYAGCDLYDYSAEAEVDEGLDMYEPDGW